MAEQKYAFITVHEDHDITYRIPVNNESDAWLREPTEFTEDQVWEDHGGNIEITEVEMEHE